MVYGQTGAGKTHTMSGGVWKNNGLIQQYVKDKIDDIKKLEDDKNRKEKRISITMN
jgi:hypothetical protein